MKLVLNAITTGAHIRTGTIFRNRMINVSITNAKLFHRAVRICTDVSGVDEGVATTCILRAIHDRNDTFDVGVLGKAGHAPHHASSVASGGEGGSSNTAIASSSPLAILTFEQIASLPLSVHIVAAMARRLVVPTALLLALDELAALKGVAQNPEGFIRPRPLTVADARDALRREPVVRRAIMEAFHE